MPLSRCLAAMAVLVLAGAPLVPPAWSGAADSLAAPWERVMRDLHVPGMAVVIVRDTGIVRIETLGYRDLDRRLPVTSATRFYIASCTKPFVATAAALLAHDGRLDLPGRFEIDAGGRVGAVWIGMAPPDSTRFVRE
jgi:CubicO group peptidase (beta-lactamase class C family)